MRIRRIGGWLVGVVISWAAGPLLAAPAGIAAAPATPKEESSFSADKAFRFRVTPGGATGSKPECRGTLETRATGGAYRPVWSRALLNDVAPVAAAVSADGRHVATFDNRGRLGLGQTAVVIYGPDGELVRSLSLLDFLLPEEIDHLAMIGDSVRWYEGAKLEEGEATLILEMRVRQDAPGGAPRTIAARVDAAYGSPLREGDAKLREQATQCSALVHETMRIPFGERCRATGKSDVWCALCAAADGPPTSSKQFVLDGIVTSLNPIEGEHVLDRWLVKLLVERVVSGELAASTFSFPVHSPAQEGLEIGQRHRFKVSWSGRQFEVERSHAARIEALRGALPVGFVGNTWPGKNGTPLEAAFVTNRKPPARGAIVTLVPSERSLPVVTSRVGRSAHDAHDDATVVRLEPIKNRAWLDWKPWAVDDGRYPRVMVLNGKAPAARALDPKTLAPEDLPRRTPDFNFILAVDVDGDAHPDFVARQVCMDGSTGCDEFLCDELWVKAEGVWRRRDRTCGD